MAPTPTYRVRIQAIVLAPPTQADPLRTSSGTLFGPNEVDDLIAKVNTLYAQAGIELAFDPATDLEGESSTLASAGGEFLEARAALYQGKAVVFFIEGSGGLSGPGPYALCLKQAVDIDLVRHVAHELGHFLGLPHTHCECLRLSRGMYSAAERAKPCNGKQWTYLEDTVRAALLPKLQGTTLTPELISEGEKIIAEQCDGDKEASITDTNPSIQEWPSTAGDLCSAVIGFPVTFKTGVTHVFKFTPDRTNLMSYFACPQADKFSAQQIGVMRSLIETEYRRHLVGPALRWSGWYEVPGEGFTDTSVAATDAGPLTVVAKGTGGGLFCNQATLQGGGLDWGGSWVELEGQGQAAFAPAAASFDDKLYVFAVGSTGLIFHNFAGAGEPFQSEWFEVPGRGAASGAPAAVAFDNRLHLLVIGSSGLIFQNFAEAGQPFQDQWFEVPGHGGGKGAPAAVAFDNKLYLFVVGPTGLIFHNFGEAGQPFQNQWFEVPGGGTSKASPAAVALRDTLYVFAVGNDNRIYASSGKSVGELWLG